MFPQNGLISAKLRSPTKIPSSLPAAERALPAPEFPVELQKGARPPGLLCAWGCQPRSISATVPLDWHRQAGYGCHHTHVQLLRAPTGTFSFPPRSCTHTSYVHTYVHTPAQLPSLAHRLHPGAGWSHTRHTHTHTLSVLHTSANSLTTTHTLSHTQLFFLAPGTA